MKRIQIIFLFLITLTILSVVSNREDTNYYSEYDTRFTCGLKYDFELLEISHELKRDTGKEELSIFTIQNAVITGTQQKIIKNISRQIFQPANGKTFYSLKLFNLENLNQKSLFPSRAPPFYS